ncbi:MAG: DUF1080 domain-containing protein [Bacteroidaceae bacterium]|nr:DUF1080 domain-containing protein [Bacteroidaceae bacterium]
MKTAGLKFFVLAVLVSFVARATADTTYNLGPKTPENDLIKLRYALDEAKSGKEKKQILKKIGDGGTFIGLMTAGRLIDDKSVGKAAARAVAQIGLTHKDYAGANVRELLRKAQTRVGGKTRRDIVAYLERMPSNETGFVSLFNGRDLTGWKGLVENPIKRAQMSSVELAQKQVKADEVMRQDWKVENGLLAYVGHGYDNICTIEQYGDFEMYVDWMLDPAGKEPDAGIYLRGTPQVQIWDTARVNVGAQVGSGGLYNNKKHADKPTVVADNKVGIWNSFHIIMKGERVTVFLNGVKVVDNVVLENYWDRSRPIFPVEQIELQAHGSKVYYRDIYVKRILD